MASYLMYLTKEAEELKEELKKIAQREGKTIASLTVEFWAKYVKEHGEGNPSFSLDKFADPAFRALPTMGPMTIL